LKKKGIKVMDKQEILNFLISNKQELNKKYGVTSIGLFGSYARDEAKHDSDIDIAVEIKSRNKFRSFFGLKMYLENHLNNKVDLGIESTIKSTVKDYILKDMIYV